MRSNAGTTYPELRHLEVEGANDVYPQDVEAEANEWFQKVYHEQLNIDEFVAMLKGWQVCGVAFWLLHSLHDNILKGRCVCIAQAATCIHVSVA